MTEELWRPPPRSVMARSIYASATQMRKLKPEMFELDLDIILDVAQRSSGLKDFGDGEMTTAFQCLLDSIKNEANLNDVGRAGFRQMIDIALKNRLRLVQLKRERPELFKVEINRPVFILGGSRTGTTLLQRLLAVDPSNRALMAWEMTSWQALGKNDPKVNKKAIKIASIGHQAMHLLNPTMKAVHFSGATLPEECVLLMGGDGLNWALMSNLNVPSYSKWLETQDFTGSYQRHREFLQVFQGDNPPRRWILKAPYHMPEIEALLKVYPDACVIHTHRDIVETVTSTASLYSVFRSTLSDHVDPAAVGSYVVEVLEDWFARAEKARNNPPSGARPQFMDIQFKELVSDTMATVQKIYDAFDMELTDEAIAIMKAHLVENKKTKHGKHRYTPGQFGLNPDAVKERFASYTEIYG